MIFDMPSCGGCKTCELACGLRHTGVFQPAASSIRIIEKADRCGYTVLLLEEGEGTHVACDGCQGLDQPLCVEYCREPEELTEMIAALMENTGAKVEAGGHETNESGR